jgi:hypothetical protein
VARLLALAALVLGLALLFGRRRRRSAPAPAVSPEADELRARLAESRAAEEAVQDAEPDEPEPPAGELDGRRAEVHERARRALGELA